MLDVSLSKHFRRRKCITRGSGSIADGFGVHNIISEGAWVGEALRPNGTTIHNLVLSIIRYFSCVSEGENNMSSAFFVPLHADGCLRLTGDIA